MHSIRFVALLAAALLTGCGAERTVAGAIRLERWKDGKTYYLHRHGYDDSDRGGSYIGGIVLQLGWNTRWILAKRYSIYRGDRDGWIIIDVQTSALTGPFTDAEIRNRPEAEGITIYNAEQAWLRL